MSQEGDILVFGGEGDPINISNMRRRMETHESNVKKLESDLADTAEAIGKNKKLTNVIGNALIYGSQLIAWELLIASWHVSDNELALLCAIVSLTIFVIGTIACVLLIKNFFLKKGD